MFGVFMITSISLRARPARARFVEVGFVAGSPLRLASPPHRVIGRNIDGAWLTMADRCLLLSCSASDRQHPAEGKTEGGS